MKNFLQQIFNKIDKLDKYASSYIRYSHNIEIPTLAYTNWAVHLAEIEDYNSAIEKLETAVLMSNQNPKPCITLGVIYAKLKDYEKAEDILKLAIKRDSQNAYSYSVLSSVLIAKDNFFEAEEFLKKGLKLSPNNAELFLNYGILYTKQQKKFKAIEMFKKAKFLNPTNFHSYFLLGVLYFETDKIAEAFCEFKQLENIDPNYKKLNYYLAVCYKKEKNYMAVMEYAQRAIEDEPDNPLIYVLLAQNYINLNKNESCLEVYETAEKRGIGDFGFYLSWGIILTKMQKINDAKEKLNIALSIKENNSDALYRIGICFYKEHDFDNAKMYYERAIKADNKNSLAYSDLGILYYESQQFENAIHCFNQAVNLSVDNYYLYFYIANSYYKQGQIKKSIEYYEKTIEYYPRHIEAYINCAVSYLDLNSTKEALRKIRSAYQIDRESEKVILIYALTGLKSGLFNDAIEKTDIILNKFPDNNDAKLIKAHCLINLNKIPEAINILCSLPVEEQSSILFIYLNYLAYKKLVEESPSNYNESMLNLYIDKLDKLKSNHHSEKEVSAYINHTLNINKG